MGWNSDSEIVGVIWLAVVNIQESWDWIGISMAEFLYRIESVWKPHPGQAKFLLHSAKTKVLACGRRWGKSQVLAAQVLFRLLCRSSTQQILVSPSMAQSRLLFDLLPGWVEDLTGQQPSRKGFVLQNGSLPKLEWFGSAVLARSAAQGHRLRGNSATDLILDEAAYLPAGYLDSVLMPMMATTGG